MISSVPQTVAPRAAIAFLTRGPGLAFGDMSKTTSVAMVSGGMNPWHGAAPDRQKTGATGVTAGTTPTELERSHR
jgi:hypothetical protein